MTKVVVVEKFKKHFGSLKAVDGISFDMHKGEILGFLGPNGAGKSTTIRCLMGFNKPTEGSIKVFGYDMAKHADKAKKDIGYLSGNVRLYDHWSGWDHIHFFEKVRGKSDNIQDLIDRLDFNPNAKFRNLSSGNKQKLGLILALMHKPKLIIMDEPTVGLDPLLQFEIYKLLEDMRDAGSTILISSHNLPEVERLCDRVAIIKEGKLIEVSPIKALSGKKLHRVIVHFNGKFDKKDFNLPGVDNVLALPDGLEFTVNGSPSEVLKVIAKYEVTDVEFGHASLEDIFMKFYERGE